GGGGDPAVPGLPPVATGRSGPFGTVESRAGHLGKRTAAGRTASVVQLPGSAALRLGQRRGRPARWRALRCLAVTSHLGCGDWPRRRQARRHLGDRAGRDPAWPGTTTTGRTTQ